MTERILVTGGAGYLGSILVPVLLESGHHVTVLDIFPRGDTELAAVCANPNFMPIEGNVRDDKLVASLVAKADIIIPLAALVGAPLCKRDPLTATAVNRDSVLSLIKKVSRSQKLLYPTTNSGYGVGEPGKECTEDTPLRPISLYGVDKVEVERAILDSGNGITFRLATVFGMAPRMRIDLLVNDFTLRAVLDRAVVIFEGHFKRNYIHVRDVARAFLHGIDNYANMNNKPFNVGLSSANLSKLELCARISAHVPQFTYIEAPVGEDPDKRDYIVSNSRIEATGWSPRHSLDDGIVELIKGYRMLNTRRFANV
jgi:nucleoside-diphosphate-sugar epimerase